MKTCVVQFADLSARKRWTIEAFLSEATAPSSSHATRPICDLVVLRKETVDPAEYGDSLISYVGLENVAPNTGDLVEFRKIPGKDIKSKSRRFRPGDVLYGRLRPYLNKVLLATDALGNGICSNEFIVLVAKKDLVNPAFLRAALASKRLLDQVVGLQTGSALPRLQPEDLLAMEIPVPTMDTQTRVAALLEEHEAERRRLRERLAELVDVDLDGILGAIRETDQ